MIKLKDYDEIKYLISNSVWYSVRNSVQISVQNSVWNSVLDSVWGSVGQITYRLSWDTKGGKYD